MALLDPLFGSAAISEVFSDAARLQRMLDFEAALALAEARCGVIPNAAADAIASKCKVELINTDALAGATVESANPAIPLVKQLTALVAKDNPDAAQFVHWGATSQDANDTGLVLQIREALKILEAELSALCSGLAELAQKHRSTPIAGRTLMQHALPTTFGVKVAAWLDGMNRHRDRFAHTRKRALVVQFGGAVGTLAALRNKGLQVAEALATELDLALPAMPWHTQRDRIAEVATTLGLCTGSLGKMARDISLHMQTEISEISEPAADGRGGSSTMPHKRNPVSAAIVLSAATRVPGLVSTMLSAMVQEDERGLGNWHAEWETLPEIFRLTARALHQW
jgi:3-carboxy-cis,cis-muconate cycloisomerase